MQRVRWLAAGLVGMSLTLSACANSEEALGEASTHAALVQPVKGTDLNQVTLSPEAFGRLGIKTEPARAGRGSGAGRTASVLPLAAVMYDAEGGTWAYTATQERTFVRVPITLDHTVGDLVYVRDGLTPGTPVVTVGAAELLGAEYGVDGE